MIRFIIIMLCFSCFYVDAQLDYDKLERLLRADGSDKIDDRLGYFARKEFSSLISTNANGMIGDYIGLSTKDNTLQLAYNFVSKN